MSKEVTPKLRFPEFKNADYWIADFLGNFSNIVRGGSPRPIESFLTKDPDSLNWLKIGDVDKDAKYVTHTEEKVLKTALSKTRVVKPDDLIMSNSMSFGRPYIMKIESCIHDGWIAITQIDKNLNRDFLYYLISSESSQKFFLDNAAGSGVKNLNVEIIKKLPIVYTLNKKEQLKIAECFSSLDDLITAQNAKFDALKNYRKGLLQKLFPQDGETVPRLRFPEFKNSGGWEEKTLDEIADLSSGGTPSKAEPKYWDGDIPWISASSMYDIKIRRSELYVTKEAIGNGTRLAYPNTLLILTRGSMLFNRIPICILEVEATFNQDVKAIIIKNNTKPYFLLYHLFSYEQHIPVDKTGIGAGKIDSLELKKLKLFIPPSIKEQEKISNFLCSIDDEIEARTEILEALKLHKKGLLQQLFPYRAEAYNE